MFTSFIFSVFVNVVKNAISEAKKASAEKEALKLERKALELNAKAAEIRRAYLDTKEVAASIAQPVVKRPAAAAKVVEQPIEAPKETPVKVVEQPKAPKSPKKTKNAETPRAPKAASKPQTTQELIEESKTTGQGEAFIVDGTFQVYCSAGCSDAICKRVMRLARKVWEIEGVKPSPQRIHSLSEGNQVAAPKSPKKAEKKEAPVEQPKDEAQNIEQPKPSKPAKKQAKKAEQKAEPKAEKAETKAEQPAEPKKAKKAKKAEKKADRAHCADGDKIDWSKPESFTDSMSKILMAHKLHSLDFGKKSFSIIVPSATGKESVAEAKGIRLTEDCTLCVNIERENGRAAFVSANFVNIDDLKKMNELTRLMA